MRFVAGDREPHATRPGTSARPQPLGEALAELHAEWPLDLVHAHYALPAGGAALPFAREHALPLVVSVHGGDVLGPLLQTDDARAAVADVLGGAAEVLCNSRATLERVAELIRRRRAPARGPPGRRRAGRPAAEARAPDGRDARAT